MKLSGIDLGSILVRFKIMFGISMESILTYRGPVFGLVRDRYGIDAGSNLNRFKVAVGSVWVRCWIGSIFVLDCFDVRLVRFGVVVGQFFG